MYIYTVLKGYQFNAHYLFLKYVFPFMYCITQCVSNVLTLRC